MNVRDDNRPTIPVPPSAAQKAFARAALKAATATEKLASELKKRPSLQLVLWEIEVAGLELEAARAALHTEAVVYADASGADADDTDGPVSR